MKRKVNKFFLVISISFLIIVGFSSCDLLMDLGNGTLEIDFSSVSGRGINWLPEIDMDLDHYIIEATGPNKDDSFLEENFSGSLFVKEALSVGTWLITIDGYNDEDIKIGTTSFSVTIRKSQTTEVNATITPLEGVGNLNVSLSWSDSQDKMAAPQASIIIRDKDGNIIVDEDGLEEYKEPIPLTINIEDKTAAGLVENIPNGYYEVTIVLLEGIPGSEAEVVWQEVHNLRVVKDKTTDGIVVIPENEILFGLGQLSANIVDGMNNPFGLSFTTLPDSVKEEERLTVVAAGEYGDEASFRWYVNGVKQAETTNTLIFTPSIEGVYKISLLVNDNDAVSGYAQSLEVAKATEEVALDIASLEIEYLAGEDSNSVLNNLVLPTHGSNGTRITWESNNEARISNDGTVTRAAFSLGDSQVQLTATVERGTANDSKTFDLNVIKLPQTDAEAVAADKSSLEVGFAGIDTSDNVTQDLTLITSGENGTIITWQSNNTETIATNGEVFRPDYTSESDITVTLTATITKGEVSETKTFSLVVKIVLQEQTVTYISNEGSIVESQTVYWGSLIEKPTSPTRVGYSFEGWFTDIGLTNQWNFDTDYVDGDITLYAMWSMAVTVTFDAQGGINLNPKSKIVKTGKTYGELASTVKVGHTFLGWYTEPEEERSQITPDTMVTINAGHTLFAKWAPNTYTITFDAKEGAISDFTTKKATYGQAYGVLPVPISSRDNDKFVGWWTGLGEEGIQVSNSTVFTGLIDITLYAKWKFDVYIGEAGGLVFYENPNYLTDGWRYLEAAPFGWYDGGNDPTFQWGSVGYPSTNPAISTAVGTGKANTESIVFHHDTLWIIYPEKGDYYTNPTAYSSFSDGTVAAKVCTEYSVIHENKTYNDWFLPSKDELALMKINLHEESLGGFTDSYYWSSSLLSYSSDGAWAQYFKSWQHQDGNSNSFKYLVRPVRAY